MSLDFSPLFRTAIGFDRLAQAVQTAQGSPHVGYPPYNIEKLEEDQYRITMAVSGFARSDLDITVKDNELVVVGRVSAGAVTGKLLYQGIASRAFERRFALADHLVVEDADLRDGLLRIGLRRVVPEALKPRKIAIGASD